MSIKDYYEKNVSFRIECFTIKELFNWLKKIFSNFNFIRIKYIDVKVEIKYI